MTLNDYTDAFGRVHDKPCPNGAYSSNNGWLYTAVAKKLGAPVEVSKLYAHLCADARTRHLGDYEPPISRDEILGLAYLGFSTELDLLESRWNFCPYELPKLNLFKLIAQLWKCRGQHRNYFWKNKLTQVYHVAFLTPFHDRHFHMSCMGGFSVIYWLIAKIYEMKKPTDKSSRLIRFLKTGEDREAVRFYFGEDHPLCAYI